MKRRREIIGLRNRDREFLEEVGFKMAWMAIGCPTHNQHTVPCTQRGISGGLETSGRDTATRTEDWKEQGQQSREWEDTRIKN